MLAAGVRTESYLLVQRNLVKYNILIVAWQRYYHPGGRTCRHVVVFVR